MMHINPLKIWTPVFANDLDAFVPEVWAQESLMILYENIVMAGLVHTDFKNEIAQEGDVVNTRRPAKFTTKRKVDTDDVTDQDATATNVAVNLNQHHHVSFIIKDGEQSKGMGNLRQTYLEPAVAAIAQGIDEMCLAEKYNFVANGAGDLSGALVKGDIAAADRVLNTTLCPQLGRHLILTPGQKEDILGIGDFTTADKIGDQGTMMRTASLGNVWGFNMFMSQNARAVSDPDTLDTGAVNNASGYAAGTTSLTTDGFSATIPPGSICTIAGDDTPQRVVTGGASPTTLVISPGLKSAVVDNAVITVVEPALVNLTAGYAANYTKEMIIDDLTATAPQLGQMMGDASGNYYGVVASPDSPSTTLVQANRGLDGALANNAVLGLGPAGEFGFAFHRNAMTLVTRPLAAPEPGTGALSAVAEMDGVGIRVTITYDGKAQGHRVTVDLLAGVKTLDTNLGCLLYSG